MSNYLAWQILCNNLKVFVMKYGFGRSQTLLHIIHKLIPVNMVLQLSRSIALTNLLLLKEIERQHFHFHMGVGIRESISVWCTIQV